MAGSLQGDSVNASLLKQLECPVCFETCLPPIKMCVKTHIVCSKCAPTLTECAICRQPMAAERCFFAEDMCSKVKLPCSNTGEGCKEVFSLKELETHLPDCRFKSYPCMIHEGSDKKLTNGEWKHCKWTGQLSALFNHVSSAHKGKCTTENELMTFNKPSIWFRVKHDSLCDCVLVSTKNELFWCTILWRQENQEMDFFCLFNGPQSLASKFSYGFKLGEEKANTIKLCNYTMLLNLEDREGKTFKLSKDLLKLLFTAEDDLDMQMFIKEK